ncbi:MAG TPA: hypothetical protein ENI26_08515, partial [Methylophaga aminisulfidivorans]|nr:hypothetical protein [Methylophaga aminisulfidivorans]
MSLNLFENTNIPYVIYASNYEQKYAGVRALHHLCHALNQLGQEAYIVGCSITNNKLQTPFLTQSELSRMISVGVNPIVVYPEVVHGNPLDSSSVVRWILNTPGHIGGDKQFDSDEQLFCYSQDFVPSEMSALNLRVPVIDQSIFNNTDNPHDDKRQGTCFYANKYLIAGYKLTDDVRESVSLCQDVKLTRTELAAILRKSELMYCYEPSALMTEAKLCGCPVVMIDTPYLNPELEIDIKGYGISFGTAPEDIDEAKRTVHKESEIYDQVISDSWSDIIRFVETTQAHFALSSNLGNRTQLYLKLNQLIQYSEREAHEERLLPAKLGFHDWFAKNSLTEVKATFMAERMVNEWRHQPSFHLIVVVNATELEPLSLTLESLQTQLYQAWGLTILSNIPAPDIFNDVPENIEWIQIHSTLNEEIEKAVQTAQLDWLLQLIPGDKLTPHALLSFAETINMASDKHFIYSDEVVDESKADIWFKPEFNLDYLRAFSYLGRSFIVSREAFERIGGYTGLAYVHTTDLAFKVSENYGEKAFAHIPDV